MEYFGFIILNCSKDGGELKLLLLLVFERTKGFIFYAESQVAYRRIGTANDEAV